MGRVLARVVTWPLVPALLVGALACAAVERGDAGPAIQPADLTIVVVLVACWLVGVVVTGRAAEQAAGWAFVGLATAVAWSGFADEYAAAGRAEDWPAWQLMATLGDSSFAWWFVFLALILQLTPPQRDRSRLVGALPLLTIGSGAVFQLMALLRSTRLDSPREDLTSPLAVAELAGVTKVVAAVAVYVLGICLVASVVVLVRAWRRAEEQSRQQLLWLVAGAVPLAPAVVGAFVSSRDGENGVAALLVGFAMMTLVLGAGLSVLRYRLYDVERIVTESAAYAIASAALIVAFVSVVVVVNSSTPMGAGDRLTTVAATLAGVAAARTSYVWGRRAVGRRVNPRRYDAVALVRSGLVAATADLDELVARALGSTARVLYPAGDGWVSSDGRAAVPGHEWVDVVRRGEVTARVEFDPEQSDRPVVEAVALEAAAEIDNVALRAELARQVDLISESRARLATAHLDERRRIERDLHDGAQQRLLAIALQLQAARLNGDTVTLDAETERAIDELQATIRQLRDLAAGLLPSALVGGGLVSAVAEMAARSPVVLHYDVVDERFPAAVEGAAWFVVSEAVTNAIKHSGAAAVEIAVEKAQAGLRVSVVDEGVGAADPNGGGLQGLSDRVSALGGVLQVRELSPHGTQIEAVFPCAS